MRSSITSITCDVCDKTIIEFERYFYLQTREKGIYYRTSDGKRLCKGCLKRYVGVLE